MNSKIKKFNFQFCDLFIFDYIHGFHLSERIISCQYFNTNNSKTPNVTFGIVFLFIQQFRRTPLIIFDLFFIDLVSLVI